MTVPKHEHSAAGVVRQFFDAMNAQDADAAVALARADVVIALGPNELHGHDALRELAHQVDEQLSVQLVPIEIDEENATSVSVAARRIQRWRSTGETAGEQPVRASFTLDRAGAIARVELA